MNRSQHQSVPSQRPHFSRQCTHRCRAGFTLMEVLLVLGILGVIMAMVVPRVLGRQKDAYIQAAKAAFTASPKHSSCTHSITAALIPQPARD